MSTQWVTYMIIDYLCFQTDIKKLLWKVFADEFVKMADTKTEYESC